MFADNAPQGCYAADGYAYMPKLKYESLPFIPLEWGSEIPPIGWKTLRVYREDKPGPTLWWIDPARDKYVHSIPVIFTDAEQEIVRPPCISHAGVRNIVAV